MNLGEAMIPYGNKSTSDKKKKSRSSLKTSVLQMMTTKKVKRQPTEWEKILANHVSDEKPP